MQKNNLELQYQWTQAHDAMLGKGPGLALETAFNKAIALARNLNRYAITITYSTYRAERDGRS
jgi:hypothetical protein